MSGPTHRAYTVIKREGKEDYWLNLGVAFAHDDGESLWIAPATARAATRLN